MNSKKPNIRLLYSILAAIAVIGIILFVIFSKIEMIAGFMLGIAVTAGVIMTVVQTMMTLYNTGGEKNAKVNFLSGPMPKLVLMITGVVLCKVLPNVFSMFGYVIGLATYALVFITVAVLEFFKTK